MLALGAYTLIGQSDLPRLVHPKGRVPPLEADWKIVRDINYMGHILAGLGDLAFIGFWPSTEEQDSKMAKV